MEMGANHSIHLVIGMVAILAVATSFIAIDCSAEDPSDTVIIEQDGILYDLESSNPYDPTASVIGLADGFDGDSVSIASEVTYGGDDYRVRNVSSGAFEGQTGIVSVKLPQTVSDLGPRAFAGCTSLVDINIPSGVTELRETFVGCTSLESIILTGNYYTTYLQGTFAGCVNLRDVAIFWTVEVGDDTFAGCESLTNISTNRIASLGDRSFMGCTSLESLDIRSLDLHGRISAIGDSAFAGCTSLTSVDIRDPSHLRVGDRAFADCISLSSVSIDEGVESLGDGVFSGCASLSSISFLDDSCEVGKDVFLGCGSISHVRIHSPEVLGQLALGDGLVTLAVGGGITDISGMLFPALANLRTLVIEDGVESVDDGAFTGSHGLELIAVPGSFATIGGSAFDVEGQCMVAGPDGCLDSAGVADPHYGNLIVYDVSGRPDTASHRLYGWAEPGDAVVPGIEDLDGCTVAVTIGEEEVRDGFTMPDGDVSVDVRYDDCQRFVAYFDRNILISYYWVHIGDQIPIPEDPHIASSDDYIYEFTGWRDLVPGDVVTGSVWFNSEYRAILTDDSGAETVDGIIEFDDAIDFPLHIPGDVAHDLLARTIVEGADGVSFSLSSRYDMVWITLDAGDLANIDEDGLTISISQPDIFLYHVDLDASEGVTVDVDLPWRSSDMTTTVDLVGEDGSLQRQESSSVWHGWRFVRFTVSESGTYQTDNSGIDPDRGFMIVLGVFVLLVAIATVVSIYARNRDHS